MIKKITISIFSFFIFVSSSWACEIQTYATIIKLKNNLNHSIIKSSDCPQKVKENFIQSLSSIEGKLPGSSIISMLSGTLKRTIPKRVEVIALKNYLYQNYDEDTYKIKSLNPIASQSSLNIDNKSSLIIKCRNCDSSGLKSIKLETAAKSIWLSAEFIKAHEVIVLNKDFRPRLEALTSKDVTIKKVFIPQTQNLFFDVKNIQHYSINKFIPKGRVLRNYDLSPINLVKPGRPVDLFIESQNLSLRVKAMPRQLGQIGKVVELLNIKTKKKIFATVTGFNKAKMKL